MKKLLVMLLAAAMALSAAAMAETYTHDDLRFEYDGAAFEITLEDHTDDEDLVVLGFKNEAWGEGYIRVHLRDLEDGDVFPTLADFKDIEESLNTEVTQGDWAGFTDVISYDTTTEGILENVFIAPVYDEDDREVEDMLTVSIGVELLDDEETGMARDDAISAVVNSLKIVDD